MTISRRSSSVSGVGIGSYKLAHSIALSSSSSFTIAAQPLRSERLARPHNLAILKWQNVSRVTFLRMISSRLPPASLASHQI
jgi:hypothetical protein